MGMCHVAAAALEAGHEVDLLDLRFVRDRECMVKAVAESDAQVVALGFQTPDRDIAFDVAGVARRHGKVVVAGGHHPTIVPEDLLQSGLFDYVVRGEGELAIGPLLDEIARKGASGPRIIDGPVVKRLDSMPFPYIFPLYRENVLKAKHVLPIMVSRRCPGTCKFCYPVEKLVFGPKTKWRTVDDVFAEIDLYYEPYSIREVLIYDNMFTTWTKYVVEFARRKVEGGYEFVYGVNARADRLDEETVRALSESGCTMVFLGVESGSQRMLDFMGKRMRVEDNLRAAELCRRFGIAVLANLLVGVPGETEEDYELTYDLVKKMRPDVIAYNCFTPFPGTEWHRYCLENGLIDPEIPYRAYEMHLAKTNRLLQGVDYARVKRWEARILELARNQPPVMSSASLAKLEEALALRALGRRAEAEEAFQEMLLRAQPVQGERKRVALARLEAGDLEGYKEAILKEREISPHDPEVALHLSRIRRMEGALEEALTFALEAARAKFPWSHYELGWVLREMGRLGEAEEAFGKETGEDAAISARIEMARCMVERGGLKEARDLLLSLLEEHPEAESAGRSLHGELGRVYFMLGDYVNAVRELSLELARAGPGEELSSSLAYSLERCGRTEEARAQFIAVCGNAGYGRERRAWAWFHLGRIALRDGLPEEARSAFRKCLELDPGRSEAARALGALEQSRLPAEAGPARHGSGSPGQRRRALASLSGTKPGFRKSVQ